MSDNSEKFYEYQRRVQQISAKMDAMENGQMQPQPRHERKRLGKMKKYLIIAAVIAIIVFLMFWSKLRIIWII